MFYADAGKAPSRCGSCRRQATEGGYFQLQSDWKFAFWQSPKAPLLRHAALRRATSSTTEEAFSLPNVVL